MIRKICVLVCLGLAVTTLAVAILSYRWEIVFSGRKQGISVWKDFAGFETQSDFLSLQTAPRTSVLNGDFQCLWVSKGQTNTSVRRVNARLFRWRQTSVGLFGSASSLPMIRIYAGLLSSQLTVPLWGPLALLLIYPALAFVRGPVCRHRRLKRGLCPTCGYNLTGNITGTCPECGKPHIP
jgi:hypothetical protein